MTWLPDGNPLVALRIDTHIHHERAIRWFRACSPNQFATCPLTQGTLLRVHITLALDGTAAAAWEALTEVVSHRRHVLWLDNFSYLEVSPQLLQGPKQVTDAWLAELARRKSPKLATLDQGLAVLYCDVTELVPG